MQVVFYAAAAVVVVALDIRWRRPYRKRCRVWPRAFPAWSSSWLRQGAARHSSPHAWRSGQVRVVCMRVLYGMFKQLLEPPKKLLMKAKSRAKRIVSAALHCWLLESAASFLPPSPVAVGELERAEKRLATLAGVRPPYMDEYEALTAQLQVR